MERGYIYPPRPETKSPSSGLPVYERMGFWGQPKLNGSCAVLTISEANVDIMNRHREHFAIEPKYMEDLRKLHRGSGEIRLVGEYMNKSTKDSDGKPLVGFVVFDIIVYNDQHLIGSTVAERQSLLDSIYRTTPYNAYIDSIDGCPYAFRVKNFTKGFTELYQEMIKVDMIEGLVLKRPDGILENGIREKNNTGWQLKVRKPTKNYQY